MSQKYGDAKMPSLRDKIKAQALAQVEVKSEVSEVKVVKKGRRLSK